jgi:glycosyltransferase involved in cell wall biosynthesis
MPPRPARVLLIHSIPTPYRLPLFQRLAREPGLDLTVYFMSASASNRLWPATALGLPRAKILPGITINLRSGGDIFPIWVNPTAPLEVFRGNFDAVICAGWDSMTTFLVRAACLIKRTPFILWAGSTPNEQSWRRSVTSLPVRALVRSADACLAYGTAAKSYLENLGAKQVVISYNTVDVRAFEEKTAELEKQRDLVKRQLGIEAKLVVLYVGQLIERKGVMTLSNALSRLDSELNVAMLWVGYGKLRQQLEHAVHGDKRLRQYFCSAQNIDELSRFYAVADVCVLPSYEEVWGLVVNESLASGVPVITTSAVGSARDLIRDGINGFVVPPGDEGAIADRIADVLTSKTGRDQWSREVRETMQDFTYEQNVTAFRTALSAVVH